MRSVRSVGGGGLVSFVKAEQLIGLATAVVAQRRGVTIDDVVNRYSVSKRTAQRMLRVLETQFKDTEVVFDEDGRKRWRLPSGALRDLLTVEAEELATLDLAIEFLASSGMVLEGATLARLRDKIFAMIPKTKAARLDTDHEALLEAQGLAHRPGPRLSIDPSIAAVIAEALKACRILEIEYRARDEAIARTRRVAPYGLLTGLRRYLVGCAQEDGPMRQYVVSNILSARVTDDIFERDPAFNLREYSERSFGVFQSDDEYAEVVWRFSERAAPHARRFVFHPSQLMEDQSDGSLVVRFRAAGHLEMAWHLYMWGNDVEVLAPEDLRMLVTGFQRDDFPGLP